jgi:SAPK-interacting protein 1 (Sin1), middle CRIM domain/SAPK-interacting protein 1 (Sin1), Pleckstrin-homology
MIAISESLIRRVRRMSYDEDTPCQVEHLLSTSPASGATDTGDIVNVGGSNTNPTTIHNMVDTETGRVVSDDNRRATNAPLPEPTHNTVTNTSSTSTSTAAAAAAAAATTTARRGGTGAAGAGTGAGTDTEIRGDDSKTKVVRFDSSTVKATPPSSFVKEPVENIRGRPALSSSLAKELVSSGALRAARAYNSTDNFQSTSTAGPMLTLDVFTSVEQPPLKIAVNGILTVEDVIDQVLTQHAEQKRKPPLVPDPDVYELRMLDDDDGEPDMDLPPLDRSRDIHNFGVDGVALVLKPDADINMDAITSRTASSSSIGGVGGIGATRKHRGPSLQLNMGRKDGKFFLKIHIPKNGSSHVLPVSQDMTLLDVLTKLSKKSQNATYEPKQYKFVYLGAERTESLPLETQLTAIVSDELMLVDRVPTTDLKSIEENDHAELRRYREFNVIKTNRRGKRQKRIMGIDSEKLYNKVNKLTGKDKVQRPFRLLSEIISVDVVSRSAASFRILFRDNNHEDERQYEAESRDQCLLIVDKLKRLLQVQHEKN